MSEEIQKIKVTIDGELIEVLPGTSILNAARMIGEKVAPPAMCYYSKVQDTGGKCRTCLVEVSKGSEADPRPMPKLVASCRTNVMDGMEVKNYTSEKVMKARKSVTEFLLLNHPLDCPICDQAGECKLQDLGYNNGEEGTRSEFKRRTFPKEDIGPYISLHMNRCILCYRCVKTANQLTDNGREFGVMYRGDHAEISTYINKAVDNEMIGNVIDVCPVGALTDKTFRFKQRVWFLNPVNAHRDCPNCHGEVQLWFRGDEVFRVTARKDEWGEVKDTEDGQPGWICNECRFEKKNMDDWTVDGEAPVSKKSVIHTNHYTDMVKPNDTFEAVMKRAPNITMNIHNVSEVNEPERDLSLLDRPATSQDYAESFEAFEQEALESENPNPNPN